MSRGRVRVGLWARGDERQYVRAMTERRPAHFFGRRVALGGEVRPSGSHAGGERVLVGVERPGDRRVGQVEDVLKL